jgi:hypothetical protein
VNLLLALLVFAQSSAAGAEPAARTGTLRPKPPAGLSWEDADHVADTVARLERRIKAGKPASREPIAVSERQINSYVSLTLAPKIPPAVSDLAIRFEPGTLAATGRLDLDAVRSKLPPGGAGTLLSFMSGRVPVELRGRVTGANGTGRVDVEQATVSGINLPPSLLAQLVAQATRSEKLPRGFDLLAPFPLPWSAQSLRLEAGRAIVEFAQNATTER